MSKVLFSQTGDQTILDSVVDVVIHHLNETPILFLKGNLGAGKTTFAQQLFKRLQVQQQVTSPTFNIANTYSDIDNKEFYHFDLYRIKHTEELDEFGFYEYIDSGNICIIEWPEIAEAYLQEPHLELNIEHLELQRCYTLTLV